MAAPSVPVNLLEKASALAELWSPRVAAQMNEIQFKVVRLKGDFVWHQHDDTDEAFLVLSGSMIIEFRGRSVTVNEGEMFVVPRGKEHMTRAEAECCALIIEPAGVVNTGQAGGPLTAPVDQWV